MKKILIFSALTLLSVLSASSVIACNCGKKDNSGSAASFCQAQCSGNCGGQSACSEKNFLPGQGVRQQEAKNDKPKTGEVGNSICPVSGEKVGQMGEVVKHEYNGKIYNLCCNACVKDFKKDPEKYSKLAERKVAESQEWNQQTADSKEEAHRHSH